VNEEKQCQKCMARYQKGHWAYAREACPACGGKLAEKQGVISREEKYEHYDSSSDVKFDLHGLLTPEQRREMRIVLWVGVLLISVAVAGRFLFVFLEAKEGLDNIPVWFDGVVVILLFFGCAMGVWSLFRLIKHWKAMRRSS
jgi:hypothetical protein